MPFRLTASAIAMATQTPFLPTTIVDRSSQIFEGPLSPDRYSNVPSLIIYEPVRSH